MPPVFSRPTPSVPDLPLDVVLAIARYLPPRDQCAMLPCSWTMHKLIAPVVYGRVDVWIQPRSWDKSEGLDPTPFRLLRTLAASAQYAGFPVSSRCYARHVLTFAYVSYGRQADVRGIPMLAEFLRFAIRLRHLRIDVVPASVPLLLDAFRRNSIISSPPPLLAAAYATASTIHPWSLPRLESVRSSKAAIVEPLMRKRNIHTAIVDGALSSADITNFLRNPVSLQTPQLLRLSLSIIQDSIYRHIIRATSLTFGHLEYLSIRTNAVLADPVFELLMDAEGDRLSMFPKLRGLAVNHGGHSERYITRLLEAEDWVVTNGEERLSLRMVIMGEAMWSREEREMPWEFSVGKPTPAWTWLCNVNKGMWAYA